MTCFALAFVILGLVAMHRARHWHCYAESHYQHPHWGHHWRHGSRRRRLYWLLSRLDASPAQERAIVGEIDRLRSRLHDTRRGLGNARGDLAAALRAPALDDAALGAVLGRIDAATTEARGAVLDAVRSVHGVLDNGQREQLAELVEHGPWGAWRRGGSPYRG